MRYLFTIVLVLVMSCMIHLKTSYSISTQEPASWYLPHQTVQAVASWYGSYFHGRLTANGERYNMYAATAAHKELPFGTWVRVTNTKNSKSTFVRINDRGPYIKGRAIDLSYGTARILDMIGSGVSHVKLDIYKPGSLLSQELNAIYRVPLKNKKHKIPSTSVAVNPAL